MIGSGMPNEAVFEDCHVVIQAYSEEIIKGKGGNQHTLLYPLRYNTNYYAEKLKLQNGAGSAPSFNYISLIFDAIKLFPDFQVRLQKSKEVQLSSWKNIIQTARDKGEIYSTMSDVN
jgi:hypothetical protein